MPKTRDAFALEKLTGKPLFDFEAVYKMSKNDFRARAKMKRLCFDGLYNLSELHRFVAKHMIRLQDYQIGLCNKHALSGLQDDFSFKKKLIRSNMLFNLYDEIVARILETRKKIDYLIEEIDITEHRNFMKTFSERLKQARKEVKLTQEELAKRIGVKRSTYGQFEQGRNEPNISLLPALSRELNRPVGYFLGE